MTVTVKLLLIAALMLSIVIPFGTFLLGEKSKKRYKRTIGANAFFFFSSFVIAGIMMFSGTPVQAAETAAAVSDNAVGFDIWPQHFPPVCHVWAAVLPLQARQAQRLAQSARTPAPLVSR